MKKLIINALGITSVLTMLIMVVVKVGWAGKVDNKQARVIKDRVNEVKEPENNLASMCNRIDRLSDDIAEIRPQNTVTHSKAYSSDVRHKFDESMFDDSYSYDPTDYPSENSVVNVDNKRDVNIIDDDEEPKAADVIE